MQGCNSSRPCSDHNLLLHTCAVIESCITYNVVQVQQSWLRPACAPADLTNAGISTHTSTQYKYDAISHLYLMQLQHANNMQSACVTILYSIECICGIACPRFCLACCISHKQIFAMTIIFLQVLVGPSHTCDCCLEVPSLCVRLALHDFVLLLAGTWQLSRALATLWPMPQGPTLAPPLLKGRSCWSRRTSCSSAS